MFEENQAPGGFEVIDEVTSPNMVDHGSPLGLPPGREGVKMLVHAAGNPSG
jgi:hypothetical protein